MWKDRFIELLKTVDNCPASHKFRRAFESSAKADRLESQVEKFASDVFEKIVEWELLNDAKEGKTIMERRMNKSDKKILTQHDVLVSWINESRIRFTLGQKSILINCEESKKKEFCSALTNLIACWQDTMAVDISTVKKVVPKIGKKKLATVLKRVKGMSNDEIMKMVDQIPPKMVEELVGDEGVDRMAQTIGHSEELDRIKAAVTKRRSSFSERIRERRG